MSVLGKSLRLRLSVLILAPLIIVAIVVTVWRYENARRTADGIFDRNLVMLVLAVSRDVAFSGGDSLSETTSNLFRDAAGGTVFYHVYGPDGSFVTGYSSPPVRAAGTVLAPSEPILFDAVHQSVPVRAVSLAERVSIDGISGQSVITVWQQLEPRLAFAQTLALQSAILALILVMTVATLVIFGIRLGLRPLDQLEAAIKKRSTSDLRPIERQIPVEARGIVERLNNLFGRLTDAKAAQERLISNAAHQLRNPVAAIHTMAQATLAATTLQDSHARASELVDETRQAMRLTQQMLSLERIKGGTPVLAQADLNLFARELAARVGPDVLKTNVSFEVDAPQSPLLAQFDATLLGEAATNLVDNALRHGGPDMQNIKIATGTHQDRAWISVENDGAGFGQKDPAEMFERFKQGRESDGSGLGLAIVKEVAHLHHGVVDVDTTPTTRFQISLPLAA